MGMQLSGSLELTGSFTTSGAIVAQTLVVQTITSSITQMTGSNVFGSSLSNTQRFTGSVLTTGSLVVNGTTVTDAQLVNVVGNQSSANVGVVLNNTNATYPRIYAMQNVGGALAFYDYTSNATRMYINASGSVGIGTTSPSTLLHINSATDATLTLDSGGTSYSSILSFVIDSERAKIVGSYGSGGGGLLTFNVDSTGGSDIERMRITNAGNVGIGTTTPGQLLEVVGGEIKAGRVDSSQEGGQVSFGRALDNNTSWYLDLYGSSTSPQLRFVNVDNSVVTMAMTGSNVGIGTSTPSYKLDVNALGYGIQHYGNASNYLRTYCGSTYQLIESNGTNQFGYVSGEFFIQVGGLGEKFRIFSNGRGIFNSTTDRGYQLMVNGDASSYACEIRQSNNNANYDLLTLTHEATSGNRRMMVFNTGGFGTVGTIISTNSSTTYNTSSDYRLKEDLQDFNGLEKVSAIKVYDFKWKDSEERTNGVLAHELQEVLPYAVYGEKDELDEKGRPKMQGVDYSKLVPILIKAIQELEARVKELENK
jgi:hypothetical protein